MGAIELKIFVTRLWFINCPYGLHVLLDLFHNSHVLPCISMQVMFKTLNPQWNQTLEFPDDGSPLELHVKDHNALLPTSSIGDCVVEYQRLPPNQMADKWIPLQGVKRGEIHVQITRKIPEIQRRPSLESEPSSLIKAHQVSSQVRICYMSWKFLLYTIIGHILLQLF